MKSKPASAEENHHSKKFPHGYLITAKATGLRCHNSLGMQSRTAQRQKIHRPRRHVREESQTTTNLPAHTLHKSILCQQNCLRQCNSRWMGGFHTCSHATNWSIRVGLCQKYSQGYHNCNDSPTWKYLPRLPPDRNNACGLMVKPMSGWPGQNTDFAETHPSADNPSVFL